MLTLCRRPIIIDVCEANKYIFLVGSVLGSYKLFESRCITLYDANRLLDVSFVECLFDPVLAADQAAGQVFGPGVDFYCVSASRIIPWLG